MLTSTRSCITRLAKVTKKIATSTFWLGLPMDFKLRDSLTRRPPEDMRQLMRCIEEYKRLEDDQLQSKVKASVINHPGKAVFNQGLGRI